MIVSVLLNPITKQKCKLVLGDGLTSFGTVIEGLAVVLRVACSIPT